MKIAIISSNRASLQETGRMFERFSHEVVLVDGGKNNLRMVAEREQPDLLLVEGLSSADLVEVEGITAHHPRLAVVLASAIQTPEFLISAMRAGVREVLLSPMTADALEAAVNRIMAKRMPAQPRSPGKVLAFMSSKGGSGSTFLATNLGYQLAETNSVLLIDLNLQFGDALSFVHDGKPASSLADVARDIGRLDASFLAASTVKITPHYSILAAPEDPSQAVEVRPEHIDAILNLAAKQYDFILVDVGRALDNLSIKALDHAYRIFPVLQAGLPYLRNTKKLLAAFQALGYPPEKTELIVNRFDKHGEIGIDDIRRLLGAVHMHTVHNSFKDVNTSINHGNPLIEMARSNPVTRSLLDLTAALSPKQEESPGLLGRLFGRRQAMPQGGAIKV